MGIRWSPGCQCCGAPSCFREDLRPGGDWIDDWVNAPAGTDDTVPAGTETTIVRQAPSGTWAVDIQVQDANDAIGTQIKVANQCVEFIDDNGTTKIRLGNIEQNAEIEAPGFSSGLFESPPNTGTWTRDVDSDGLPNQASWVLSLDGTLVTFQEVDGFSDSYAADFQAVPQGAFIRIETQGDPTRYIQWPIETNFSAGQYGQFRVQLPPTIGPGGEPPPGALCHFSWNLGEPMFWLRFTEFDEASERYWRIALSQVFENLEQSPQITVCRRFDPPDEEPTPTDFEIRLEVETNPVDFGDIKVYDTEADKPGIGCPNIACDPQVICNGGPVYVIKALSCQISGMSIENAFAEYTGDILNQNDGLPDDSGFIDAKITFDISAGNGTHVASLYKGTQKLTQPEIDELFDRILCDPSSVEWAEYKWDFDPIPYADLVQGWLAEFTPSPAESYKLSFQENNPWTGAGDWFPGSAPPIARIAGIFGEGTTGPLNWVGYGHAYLASLVKPAPPGDLCGPWDVGQLPPESVIRSQLANQEDLCTSGSNLGFTNPLRSCNKPCGHWRYYRRETSVFNDSNGTWSWNCANVNEDILMEMIVEYLTI